MDYIMTSKLLVNITCALEKVVETPELCKYIGNLYLPESFSQRTPLNAHSA